MNNCSKTGVLTCVVLLVGAVVAAPALDILWSESFQGLTVSGSGDLPAGGDLIPQDGNWSLSGVNTNTGGDKAYTYAKVEDYTRGTAAPDLVELLPAGEKVLEVRVISDTSADAWHRATYDLSGTGAVPTASPVTVSARLGTLTAGSRHGKIRVGNVVECTFEANNTIYLVTDGGNTAIGADALTSDTWYDMEFVLDFDADTITVTQDSSSLGTWNMDADYAPSDVTDVALEAFSWGFAGAQGYMFADNLSVAQPVIVASTVIAVY